MYSTFFIVTFVFEYVNSKSNILHTICLCNSKTISKN